jgi:hypothetical protein
MGIQPPDEMQSPPPTYKPVGCVFAGLRWQPPLDSLYPQGIPNTKSLASDRAGPTNIDLKGSAKTSYKPSLLDLKTDEEILRAALQAPARRVLERAEALGPESGWKDGHLSKAHGFCPPDPSSSPTALALSPGNSLPRVSDT